MGAWVMKNEKNINEINAEPAAGEKTSEKGGSNIADNAIASYNDSDNLADKVRNVLFTVDKGYLSHLTVTLRSLIKSNGDKFFNVYIMSADLSEDLLAPLKTEFGNRARFKIIEMNDGEFDGFPTVKRYPVAIYYRIFAPLLITDDIERILYLDCDIIVRGDIDLIYMQDFCGNFYIGCTQVRNFLRRFNTVRLGVEKDYVYLNTGVVVMNVKALKNALNIEEIKEFTLKNKHKMIFFDQDIICKFFGDKIKLADTKRFNLSDRRIRIENLYLPDGQKIDEKWIDENAVILHYLGRNKPWKKSYRGVLLKYYDEVAGKSADFVSPADHAESLQNKKDK